MGHPWQIIVGPRGAAAGKVELKRRATGERSEVIAGRRAGAVGCERGRMQSPLPPCGRG